MPDIQFGLKLTADGSAFVGTVRVSKDEFNKLKAAVEGSTPSMNAAAAAAQRVGQAESEAAQRVRLINEEFSKQVERSRTARVAIEQLSQQLSKVGTSQPDIARTILGTRSTQQIVSEINLIKRALESLKGSAGVGPQELARASEAASAKIATLRKELDGTGESVTRFGNLINQAKSYLVGLIGIGTVLTLAREFVQLSDEATTLTARMRNATESADELASVQGRLRDVASDLQLNYADLGRGFAEVGEAVRDLGGSADTAAKIVEILAITAKQAGQSSQDAAAQASQFANALTFGVQGGREFVGILKQNDNFARELAASLGVTTQELKRMAQTGEIDGRRMTEALLSRYKEIKAGAADVPRTIGGAFTEVFNEIGRQVSGSGGGSKLATWMHEVLQDSRAMQGEVLSLGSRWTIFFGQITGNARAARDEIARMNAEARNSPRYAEGAIRGQAALDAQQPTFSGAKAFASAEAEFNKIVDQSQTVTGINRRANLAIKAIEEQYARMVEADASGATKYRAEFRKQVATIERDRALAIQGLAKKGGVSISSIFGEFDKEAALATSGFNTLLRIQQDAGKRAGEILEFQHAAQLVSEQDYIARRAALEKSAAEAEVAAIRGRYQTLLAEQQRVLATPAISADDQSTKRQKLADIQKQLNDLTIDWGIGLEKVADADRHATEGAELRRQKILADQLQINRATEDYVRALTQQVEEERFEAGLIGQTTTAQRQARAERELRRKLEDEIRTIMREIAVLEQQPGNDEKIAARRQEIERTRTATEGAVAATREGIAATDQLRERWDNVTNAVQELDSTARDIFSSMFEDGDNTFRKIGESLKKWVIDLLYQLTIKPLVINIAAQLTGANQGGLTQALGGGNNSLLSTLFGGGRSLTSRAIDLFGGGPGTGGGSFDFGAGASGAAYGADLAAGSGELAAGFDFGAGAWGAEAAAPIIEAGSTFLEAGGIFAGAAGTIGAAIPYIGIALAAASALGLFKKEPSEVRGRFQVSPETTGFEDNAYTATKFGNVGFLDADTAQFSGEAAQTFNKIVSGALDAFERRYTPEQSDRLASILQSTDFGSQEGTFTTEEFLQKYGGQVLQQVVSAAFDVLDPALGSVARQFKGTADEIAAFGNTLLGIYDVTQQIGNEDFTANVIAALGDGTKETADKVAAFVRIVASVGDSFDGLGERLQELDPESIVAFVEALGGAQQVMQSFAFLNQNFTTSAERAAAAQSHLTKAWDSSRITTDDLAKAALTTFPRTHAEFMRLFNSLDLNTEHGRELADAMLNELAPAFVAVEGSADAAAEALKRQADAGREYYNEHFLTPDEKKLQRQTVDSSALYEMSQEGTTLNRVLRELSYEQLPLTVQGVRSLYAATVAKYGADSEETAALLRAIPVIGDLIDSVDGFADSAVAAADEMRKAWEQIGEAVQTYSGMLDNLGSLAGAAPDFGSQLEDAVLLYSDQIEKLNERITAALADGRWSDVNYILYPELNEVKTLLNAASARLERYRELVGLYGEAQAEQLQQLEEKYHADLRLYAGNTAAQEILRDRFIDAWTAIRTGASEAAASLDEFIKSIQSLADSTRGNAGQQARLELALSDARLNDLQVQYAAALPGSALATALAADIDKLKLYNAGLETQLAHFTTYAAQYGVDAANQLIQLETEFASWQQQVGDNAGALAVLQEIFDDQWKAIIDSLKGGVDGSLEQLARLKQGIAEYLQSLYVSDISPLSPQEKLQQASAAYERELQLAKGGDLKALGDITQYADTLLQLDRDFYKSSDAFVAEFDRITEDLAGLAGTLPNGLPAPTGDATLALAAALPVGSTIASSSDIAKNTDATVAQSALIQQLITALANANTADAQMLAEALRDQQQVQADAEASVAK